VCCDEKKIKKMQKNKISFFLFSLPFAFKKEAKITPSVFSSRNTYTTGHIGGMNSDDMGYFRPRGKERSGMWPLSNTAVLFFCTLFSLHSRHYVFFSLPAKRFFLMRHAFMYAKTWCIAHYAPPRAPLSLSRRTIPHVLVFIINNILGVGAY
jgi:hypothetical protein